MVFAKVVEDGSQDLGEWYTYGRDPDNKKLVRFRIRPLPRPLSDQIDRRHHGKKHQFTKGGGLALDREAVHRASMDKVVYALTGSENLSVLVGDQGAADFYAKAMAREVPVGADVCIDECLTEEVKRYTLEHVTTLIAWILERAVTARAEEEEIEAELGKA